MSSKTWSVCFLNFAVFERCRDCMVMNSLDRPCFLSVRGAVTCSECAFKWQTKYTVYIKARWMSHAVSHIGHPVWLKSLLDLFSIWSPSCCYGRWYDLTLCNIVLRVSLQTQCNITGAEENRYLLLGTWFKVEVSLPVKSSHIKRYKVLACNLSSINCMYLDSNGVSSLSHPGIAVRHEYL